MAPIEFPKEESNVPFSVRIPESLLTELKVIAKEQGCTLSAATVALLRHAVSDHRAASPAKRGAAAIKNGDRVARGQGTDRDTGMVLEIKGSKATVGWDSGVRTTIDVSELERTKERHSGGRRMDVE